MGLAIIAGVGAFVILGVMFALLWLSAKRDERDDAVTQEIIIKANTGTVNVTAPVEVTQEDEH